MALLQNPPLLEAIFELRWGEHAPGQFQYTNDDQTLFAGKVSALASLNGYDHIEMLGDGSPSVFPMTLTHRYRKAENKWPCFQTGLGLFTVNQVTEGYSWSGFKQAIQECLKIFDQAGPHKLKTNKDSLVLILRYQDAFFPKNGNSAEKFLSDTFHINTSLPEKFLSKDTVEEEIVAVNCQYTIKSLDPKGEAVVKVASAIINDMPGFILETLVVSKVSSDFTTDIDQTMILEWLDKAHDLQKHSFGTLVNSEVCK
ncbi:TIGR04255 family protein [Neptunomonas japonica]|uniref:TIGR04255 family protein n=1 Tax=Neptunomonas japonica TaxID=417574 RepID=UPI0003FE417A|nr:TIGR04255 family protein [Neptunomonas japonica]